MRVLFTASDWGGHYFCMVPLGWALQAAGHEVRVACPPPQTESVSRAGLTAVPILQGPDLTYFSRLVRYQEVVDGCPKVPGPAVHPVTGRQVRDVSEFDCAAATEEFWDRTTKALHESYDRAVEYGRQFKPDLVVYDLMAPEGALVARLAGVPSVYHGAGMYGVAETEHVLEAGLEDPTGSFARHGAKPFHRDQIEYVLDPSPVQALPPHGQARRIPVRPVPYNGVGVLPDWLLEPPKARRVLVLWGVSATAMYGPYVPALRQAVTAAVASGAEVLLAATQEQVEALGPVSERVRVLPRFPMDLLLGSCDAVIHHGGANTVMNSFVAGVPQLCLDLSINSAVWRDRVAGSGAAVALSALDTTQAEIEAGLAAVLDQPRYRRAAAEVRSGLAALPTPADIVTPLTRLAATGVLPD
jgi:UDP:flavonoid glycosyltransferase YjiC (YdhE family)